MTEVDRIATLIQNAWRKHARKRPDQYPIANLKPLSKCSEAQQSALRTVARAVIADREKAKT